MSAFIQMYLIICCFDGTTRIHGFSLITTELNRVTRMNQTMTELLSLHIALFPRARPITDHRRRRMYVLPVPFYQCSNKRLFAAPPAMNHQEGNLAALTERMVESLTLNEDKKVDDTNKENSVANDANVSTCLDPTAPEVAKEEKMKIIRAIMRFACFELSVPEDQSHDSSTIYSEYFGNQEMETFWRLVIDLASSMCKDDSFVVCMNFQQRADRTCLPIKFACLLASHVKIHGGWSGRVYSMTLGDLDIYVIVSRIQVDYPDKNKAPIYGFDLGLLGHSPGHPILLHGHFPNGNHISIQQFAKLAGLSVKNVRDKFGLLAAEETAEYDLFDKETAECTMCPEELIPVDLESLEEAYGRDFEVHLFDIRCPYGVIRNTCYLLGNAEPRLSLSQLFDFNFAHFPISRTVVLSMISWLPHALDRHARVKICLFAAPARRPGHYDGRATKGVMDVMRPSTRPT
jgi:hypothetical protein